MHFNNFYRLGTLIHRYRWLIIVVWVGLFVSCIPYIPKLMQPFTSIGFIDPQSQSAQADKMLKAKLGYSTNRFIVIYNSEKLRANDARFINGVKSSLAGLKKMKVTYQIIYPFENQEQISKDKKTAYAVIMFKGQKEVDQVFLEKFKSVLKAPRDIRMKVGGEPVFLEDTKVQTQTDLYAAEYIATPVAIITMLFVFGSVVAASLPVLLGGVCMLFILMSLYILGHIFTLSVFTINIALLLGLCLSLDYSLLIVTRFREELSHGRHIVEAISITQATAGKAVFFSGLIVFISISGLLLFPITILFSVGMGGLVAVSMSILVAVILLPAILSILKHRVDSWPLPFFSHNRYHINNYWRWLATIVTNNPFAFFLTVLALLLICSYPIMHIKVDISDYRILPKTLESRQVFDDFKHKFGVTKLEPILIIIKTSYKNILTKTNIGNLYDFSNKLKRNPTVYDISSIVDTEPRLSKQQYVMLYLNPASLNQDLKKLLQLTTTSNMTVMTVISKYNSNSPPTESLIKKIRRSNPGDKMTLSVTGAPANRIDVFNKISTIFPYALFWIVGVSYLILLVSLRSVVLPLKAIMTSMLSLCASYGVIVLVIQFGYLHRLLFFEPQGMLDISLLIIIFCTLFGISMDYEVFLLTRIKEHYEQTGDNINSIIYGIDRSSKVITSAAIIVILICFSFLSADILIVKAFGLGIAVAVFIDAFLIRTILVPATMTLLGRWNWYMPKWLNAIMPKVTFDPRKYQKVTRKKQKQPDNSKT